MSNNRWWLHGAQTACILALSSTVMALGSGVRADSFSVSNNATSIVAPVKSVDVAAGTFTMTSSQPKISTDENGNMKMTQEQKDVTFFVDSRTTFRGLGGLKDIHPGDSVSATGEQQPDGRVRVQRLSAPAAGAGASAHASVMSISAPVKSVDAAHGTFVMTSFVGVRGKDKNGNFQVTREPKDVTVVITHDTDFVDPIGVKDVHPGDAGSRSFTGIKDIRPGDMLHVTGEPQADGQLSAATISR